jgi:nitric oxide reductase large subunit
VRRKFLGALWLALAVAIMLVAVRLAYEIATAVAQSPGRTGLHSLMVLGAVTLVVAIFLLALYLVTRLADLLL